jgi:CarD family transcriptional regulator
MYEIGDYVICRSGGVWRVTSADGAASELTEHERGGVKAVTDGNEEIVRRIVSKEEILDLISRIGFIRTITAPNDKIRNDFYMEAMEKYDEVEWVKVIKSVYLRKEEKRISSAESSYSEKAKGFLYGEISVLLEMAMNEVESYITAAVSDDSW